MKTAPTSITWEEKAALTEAGYSIEDMGQEWGPQFQGQYRWMNERHEDDDGDGFGVIQYSEDAAWADALQFQEQQLGIPLMIPELEVQLPR